MNPILSQYTILDLIKQFFVKREQVEYTNAFFEELEQLNGKRSILYAKFLSAHAKVLSYQIQGLPIPTKLYYEYKILLKQVKKKNEEDQIGEKMTIEEEFNRFSEYKIGVFMTLEMNINDKISLADFLILCKFAKERTKKKNVKK